MPRWTTGLFLATLAVVLTSIFAFGVIGKHRLNGTARYVFKATRAICLDPALLPLAAPPPAPPTGLPPHGAGSLLALLRPQLVYLDLVSAAPSRAPPAAWSFLTPSAVP